MSLAWRHPARLSGTEMDLISAHTPHRESSGPSADSAPPPAPTLKSQNSVAGGLQKRNRKNGLRESERPRRKA